MAGPAMTAPSPYADLAQRALACLDGRRDVSGFTAADILRARLYAYAYRTQTIGAFHATREALAPWAGDPAVALARTRLRDLQALAMQSVPRDFRAAAPVLACYHTWCDEVAWALAQVATGQAVWALRACFQEVLRRIRGSHGLVPARDDALPAQASYKVPGIEVVIVPQIYGDHLSWNSAYLTADSAGATTHRHHYQVEIHLGYGPLRGRTLLDGHAAHVESSYAMPIPPLRDHGFDNLSGHPHFVPFIFGSRVLDGCGVFFDVEPRPADTARFPTSPLESATMNHSVELDAAFDRLRRAPAGERRVLIPAERTARADTGGLELVAYRVGSDPLQVQAA